MQRIEISVVASRGQVAIKGIKSITVQAPASRNLTRNALNVLSSFVGKAFVVGKERFEKTAIKKLSPKRFSLGALERNIVSTASSKQNEHRIRIYIGGKLSGAQMGLTNKFPSEYFKYIEFGAGHYPIIRGRWIPEDFPFGAQRFVPSGGFYYTISAPTPPKFFIKAGLNELKSLISKGAPSSDIFSQKVIRVSANLINQAIDKQYKSLTV